MSYAIEGRELDATVAELFGPPPTGLAKWRPEFLVQLFLLLMVNLWLIVWVPNRLFDPDILVITWTIGTLAIWRFSWWATHAVRAEIFARRKWPEMREAADAVWRKGWRPRHLHVQVTTYKENPDITRHVVGSLIRQIGEEGIPATIWIGTATPYDERVITQIAEDHADLADVEIVFIRQNQPGKRMAIGLIMRAIMRTNPDPDDVVLFMDGDAVIGPGALRKCCAMFGADQELQALTTDEEVVCYGPWWMNRWLRMRFAQRRLAMQSHALSDKVLTLTGRMSMFRARHITNLKFIRTVEADHLDHWLWGRFRFLSGDDKSTWYHLLTCSAKMTYVPDALVLTIEVIEGSAVERQVQNLRRWSGNMLRNGARAIALGPRKVGPFIWWCIVDQRIAIWTMLVGPAITIYAGIFAPTLLVSLIVWVVLSRIVLSLWLFRYGREADMTWPFILYINQVLNAFVKVTLLFRLNRQVWANRGNQKSASGSGVLEASKVMFARLQMTIAMGAFLLVVAALTGVV